MLSLGDQPLLGAGETFNEVLCWRVVLVNLGTSLSERALSFLWITSKEVSLVWICAHVLQIYFHLLQDRRIKGCKSIPKLNNL